MRVNQWSDKIEFGFPSQTYFGIFDKIKANITYHDSAYYATLTELERRNDYNLHYTIVVPKHNKNAFISERRMFKFYPHIYDRLSGKWRRDLNAYSFVTISGDKTYDSYNIQFELLENLETSSVYSKASGYFLGALTDSTIEVPHIPSLRWAGMWTVPLEVSE